MRLPSREIEGLELRPSLVELYSLRYYVWSEHRFMTDPAYGSFLESEFDSTVTDATGAILGGVEKGNRLASVPEFQIAATGSYGFPLEMFGGSDGFVNATIHHVGDRITQPVDRCDGCLRCARAAGLLL